MISETSDSSCWMPPPCLHFRKYPERSQVSSSWLYLAPLGSCMIGRPSWSESSWIFLHKEWTQQTQWQLVIPEQCKSRRPTYRGFCRSHKIRKNGSLNGSALRWTRWESQSVCKVLLAEESLFRWKYPKGRISEQSFSNPQGPRCWRAWIVTRFSTLTQVLQAGHERWCWALRVAADWTMNLSELKRQSKLPMKVIENFEA